MADDTKTLFYTSGDVNSLNLLETTCNTDELTFKRKLQSLDTVSVDGKKATEAVYKRGDRVNLGKLKIEKFTKERESSALFKGKAFILTQPVDVLVFRD
jgi:hypothetical protein